MDERCAVCGHDENFHYYLSDACGKRIGEHPYGVRCSCKRFVAPVTAPRETGGEGEDFAQSFDANDWAQAFVGYIRDNPAIASDEATMHGWFANAIMRGFDEANRRALATPRPVEVTEGMVRVALDVADRDMREGETFASVLADSLNRQAAALRAQSAGGTPSDVCACGHRRDQHIYHEGACRPGFACGRGCGQFVARSLAPVADAGCPGCGERPCECVAAPTLPPVGEREMVVRDSGEEAERENADDVDLMNDVALAVLCRVFEDGADEGYQEWLALDKTGWSWWGRALGAFIAGRLATRPSHAPSGEPVVFGWVVADTRSGGAFFRRIYYSPESAERAMGKLVWHSRERASVIPLYGTAPHPDGQGVDE